MRAKSLSPRVECGVHGQLRTKVSLNPSSGQRQVARRSQLNRTRRAASNPHRSGVSARTWTSVNLPMVGGAVRPSVSKIASAYGSTWSDALVLTAAAPATVGPPGIPSVPGPPAHRSRLERPAGPATARNTGRTPTRWCVGYDAPAKHRGPTWVPSRPIRRRACHDHTFPSPAIQPRSVDSPGPRPGTEQWRNRCYGET